MSFCIWQRGLPRNSPAPCFPCSCCCSSLVLPTWPQVLRRLGGGSDASTDLDILRTRCLCKEEFPEQFQYQDPKKQEDAGPGFAKWWLQFWESADREHALSEQDYEKTVAAWVSVIRFHSTRTKTPLLLRHLNWNNAHEMSHAYIQAHVYQSKQAIRGCIRCT